MNKLCTPASGRRREAVIGGGDACGQRIRSGFVSRAAKYVLDLYVNNCVHGIDVHERSRADDHHRGEHSGVAGLFQGRGGISFELTTLEYSSEIGRAHV